VLVAALVDHFGKTAKEPVARGGARPSGEEVR
jgi:hypothetical protein